MQEIVNKSVRFLSFMRKKVVLLQTGLTVLTQ